MDAKVVKRRRGGRYCVAGGPNNQSCKNTSYTEGIRMHQFPSDPVIRGKWVKFVQRHRKDFAEPINKYSALCSAHFEESCYTRRFSLNLEKMDNIDMNRVLIKGSVPSRVTVFPASPEELTQRAKRKIKRDVLSVLQETKKQKIESEPTLCDEIDQEQEPAETLLPATASQETQETTTTNEGSRSEQSLPLARDSSSTPRECHKCHKRSKKCHALAKKCRRLTRNVRELKQRVTELQNRVMLTETEEETEEEVLIEHGEYDNAVSDKESVGEPYDDDENDNDLDFPYASLEEMTEESTIDEDQIPENDIRVDPETPPHGEPTFIVFYSMLLSLFSMFCFRCKGEKPKVTMKSNGTMVTVTQHCHNCHDEFQWRSQPLVNGKHPAGNLLVSMAVLLAGGSISKVLLIFRHMGLCAYNIRTFFRHQRYFLFPAILHHWEWCQNKMVLQLKQMKDIMWCGDGRFDSMGHSAKFGVYTMFCTSIMKICHFEVVQANETSGSQQTELEGCERAFSFLKDVGIPIDVFVSDRHLGITKWIRECCSNTKHFFDIWHMARTISKKLTKASKEKGCAAIGPWIKGVRNHLYWCATSTKQGFQDLIVAKWKSFMRHVANKHSNHPDKLFEKCSHGPLEPRKWIKIGTAAYDKLQSILLKTGLVNGIKKLSPDAQTSCLEGFHATLNHWHPKMICFSWMGTMCRHILASMHFNENLCRETKKSADGSNYMRVTYPKYKLGEEVIREIKCPPTYGYADAIKILIFTLTRHQMNEILKRYSSMAPESLTEQFTNRLGKKEVLQKHKENHSDRLITSLVPSAEEQELLEQQAISSTASPATAATKKQRSCKTCKKPMLGHPRSGCSKK